MAKYRVKAYLFINAHSEQDAEDEAKSVLAGASTMVEVQVRKGSAKELPQEEKVEAHK
jgi:hypothetical protein